MVMGSCEIAFNRINCVLSRSLGGVTAKVPSVLVVPLARVSVRDCGENQTLKFSGGVTAIAISLDRGSCVDAFTVRFVVVPSAENSWGLAETLTRMGPSTESLSIMYARIAEALNVV